MTPRKGTLTLVVLGEICCFVQTHDEGRGKLEGIASIEFDCLCSVEKGIRFVHNFVSKNLFNDIFRRNDPREFVERILRLLRVVDITNESYLRSTLLELSEDIAQLVVRPYEMDASTKISTKSLTRVSSSGSTKMRSLTNRSPITLFCERNSQRRVYKFRSTK